MAAREITFDTVKEDWTNRNQSWEYEAILQRTKDTVPLSRSQYRIHVRRNFYAEQSRATVEVWNGGWQFFTSMTVESWWEDTPSASKADLEAEEVGAFRWIAAHLMRDLTAAFFGAQDFVIRGSVGE